MNGKISVLLMGCMAALIALPAFARPPDAPPPPHFEGRDAPPAGGRPDYRADFRGEERPDAPRPDPRIGAQGAVRRELHQGEVHSLRDIERRVLPTMPRMQYLGPEYDPAAMAYRLKFIQGGRVVFVDVDARSGEVIGQSR